MKKDSKSEAAALRQKAEEFVTANLSKSASHLSAGEAQKLIHELEVHQIELKLQNEELILAKEQSEIASAKYTELYDFAPTGYFTLSKEGAILELNLAGAKMLGKNRAELKNRLIGIYASRASKPIFTLFLENIFERGDKQTCEISLSTAANIPMYVQLAGIIDQTGNQCFVTATDISERKKAEEEKGKIANHYQALIEKAPDGVVLLDTEGNFKYISPSAKKMFGYNQTDEVSGNPANFTHPDDLLMVLTELGKIFEDPSYEPTLEYRFIDKQGHWHWVETTFRNLTANPNVESIVLNFHDVTVRRQIENALTKSESEFHLLTEAMPQIVWITRPDGGNIYFNQQWVEYTGLTLQESYGDGWNKPFHPDDRLRAWEAWQNATTNLATYSLECRLRRFDGEYKWWLVRGVPMLDKQGTVLKWFGTFTDIEEIKCSEAELVKAKEKAEVSEEKYRMIFDKSLVAILVADDKGYYLSANEAAAELLGYSVEELKKMNVGDLKTTVKPGAHERYLEYIEKGEEKGDFDFITKSDENRIAYYHAVRVRPDFNLSMMMNITERKQAEAELREKEIQYQNLANSGPALIWTSGRDKLCNYFNESWMTFTGRTLEQELGNGWAEGVHPDDFAQCLETYVTAFDQHKAFEMEYRLMHVSGEYRWILDLGTPNYNSKGDFTGYIGNCFDITERKLVEQELVTAKEHAEQSDKLKSAFLANISHEIRTPMNGILGFAELLKNPELTSHQQMEYIRIIRKSGDRMLNIINEIVDISKIESGQMLVSHMDANINEQIEYIYTLFQQEAEAKGIKLSFQNSLSAKESIIKTDREKVYAILTNLVKNAIKYTDSGSIEFGYTLTPDAQVGVRSRTHELEFYIKDTGIGIPKDRQQAIFERFIQADIADKRAFQGAGLGLSISKAYIEMLGGRIWVESEEGKGSTFYYTLPYNAQPFGQTVVKPAVPVNDVNTQIKKLKILIAEDDEVSEMLLSMVLKKLNHEVLKVWTGYKAVDVCRTNPDIDLILMDIKMPGMDGYEATRQIRKFNKEVVIIAQTAFGQKGDREKAIDVGCNDYISKPIEIDLLMNLFQVHFNHGNIARDNNSTRIKTDLK